MTVMTGAAPPCMRCGAALQALYVRCRDACSHACTACGQHWSADQYFAPDPTDRYMREDAVQVVASALGALGCNVPVDPYDPDDVVSVAAEAVRALVAAGMLPGDGPQGVSMPTSSCCSAPGCASLASHGRP